MMKKSVKNPDFAYKQAIQNGCSNFDLFMTDCNISILSFLKNGLSFTGKIENLIIPKTC